MKSRFVILFTLLINCMTIKAMDQMLVDGKRWEYRAYHYEDDEDGYGNKVTETVSLVDFTLQGDTIIGSRSYYKVYRQAEGDAPSYYSAVREEATTVYTILSGRLEEEVLIELDTSRFEGTGADDVFYNGEPVLEITDSVTVNGRRFCLHRYGSKEWVENSDIIAVEGIGYIFNGLVMGMRFAWPTCYCDKMIFKACYENGVCIFTDADFYSLTNYVIDGIEIIDTNRQSTSEKIGNSGLLYNLQGRAVTNPRRGLYIKDGRKVVVKE